MANEDFSTELKNLLNKFSKDNESDTPDYILAKYLIDCLEAYNKAVRERRFHYIEC